MTVAEEKWFDRYGKRIEEYRLPKGRGARTSLALTIGCDGMKLLDAIYSSDSLSWLAKIPAVESLRMIWVHQYYVCEGQLHLRDAKDLPPATIRWDSPCDLQAHYATKPSVNWTGYKVHVSETCDEKAAHMITHVQTTIATQTDVETTESIHSAFDAKGRLPKQHLVDSGYISAGLLVNSPIDYQVQLVGLFALIFIGKLNRKRTCARRF